MTPKELRYLNGIYARWERIVKVGMEHPPGSKFLEPIKLRELELRTQLKELGLEVDSPVWPTPPTELPPTVSSSEGCMKIYHIFHGNKFVSGFTSQAKAHSVMNELIKLYPGTRYILYECTVLATTE